MTKVKLYYKEIPLNKAVDMDFETRMGSSPKHKWKKVEGATVPQGKTWLFPLGGNFTALSKYEGEEKYLIVYI